jgi:hypothetical protein
MSPGWRTQKSPPGSPEETRRKDPVRGHAQSAGIPNEPIAMMSWLQCPSWTLAFGAAAGKLNELWTMGRVVTEELGVFLFAIGAFEGGATLARGLVLDVGDFGTCDALDSLDATSFMPVDCCSLRHRGCPICHEF